MIKRFDVADALEDTEDSKDPEDQRFPEVVQEIVHLGT